MEAEKLFAGHALAVEVFRTTRQVLEQLGPLEVRASRSQVAFRRTRGFAFLWRPGQYLRRPAAEVVLTIALGRHDPSPRFKSVVHPSARHWMHHLEIGRIEEIDDEVRAWLAEAAARAG